ncbi:MAG: hypothetical protein K8S55_05230 [Phycisphaerae bacterium]|nr:hypothetical protein [Phycisphaerae bacterium]
MKEVRMEHTEGLGRSAEVWVDGALLNVCDGVSTAGQRCQPGLLEKVRFRYTTTEAVPWDQAVLENPSHKVILEPERGWSYIGFGRVEQVMPVVIHFGLLKMEDPNWATDEGLVGKFVRVAIDRLEVVPVEPDDFPENAR